MRAITVLRRDLAKISRSSMDPSPASPMQNHLLAELPKPEQRRWLPHLEFVDMP
jgi:hypothetical protein